MILLNEKCLPAYVVREVRNYGLHEVNTLYKFLFTREDNLLLNAGSIKLFPREMCVFTTPYEITLDGTRYEAGNRVDVSKMDDTVFKTLVKTGVLTCELQKNFKDKDDKELVNIAKLYDCVGTTFKQFAESTGIEFDILKEKFELKGNATKTKIKEEHLDGIKEILLGV